MIGASEKDVIVGGGAAPDGRLQDTVHKGIFSGELDDAGR